MKILIGYYSETGNTERVAWAMWEAVAGEHEVTLTTVPEVSVEVLGGFEVVVLGAAVHDSDLAKPLKGLLERLPANPGFKMVGFSTHAVYVPDGSVYRDNLYERWAGRSEASFIDTCQEKGISFLGYFHCQGAASEPIENFIRQVIITSDEEWERYLPELRASPSSEDFENAKAFIRQIIGQIPRE